MIPQTPDIMQSPLCYEGDKRNIPADTPLGTNQLSYKQGFPPITSIDVDAGGIAPERLDFNAALNLLSTFIYYMQSGNQFVWSNQLDYNTGAFVIGSDNAVYFCIKANGATEPNTVQDPISSTGYWVQILTSDGKLNAGALSVTLGSFAQLNSLALTDNKLTNILPPNKGGTGTEDGFNWKNTISRNELIKKIGWTSGTTQEFLNKIPYNSSIVITNYWNRSRITDLPTADNYVLTVIKGVDTNSCYIIANGGAIGFLEYRYNLQQNVWIKTRNTDGTLPSTSFADNSISSNAIISLAASKVTGLATVATSGSYNDLSNKPTIPTNVAPLPIPYAPSNLVGTWASVQVGAKYTLPAGGSWAWFGINIANNRLVASIAAGGTDIELAEGDINNRFLIWRIQ